MNTSTSSTGSTGSTSSTSSISPDIVRDIARITTLATPGVLSLVDAQSGMLQRNAFKGVEVIMNGDAAIVSLHLTAETDQSLVALGNQIKHNVTDAVDEITGIKIESVSVTFEDVRNAK